MKKTQEHPGDWLTVADMVRDLGGAVSGDKVRRWCQRNLIEGAINIGDGAKAHYRVPRAGWEKFKQSRTGSVAAPLPSRLFRSRSGTNHIGI